MNNIEKEIWDEKDFDQMNWHDSTIYAIAFDDENFTLQFDLDYVSKWIEPQEGEEFFKFLVAPVILEFENVWNLQIDIESNLKMEIYSIKRENPVPPKNVLYLKSGFEYDWTIELQQGQINFKSVGFKQHIRQQFILTQSQKLGLEQRGGISFEK